jgi:hypothetical protein
MARLAELAEKRRKFGDSAKSKDEEDSESAADEGEGDDGTTAK